MVLSKLKYLALWLTLAASTFCCAGVKEMWTTDVTKIAPHSVSAYHGEDISLECKMHINGKLYNPFPYYARFQWQTNGMGNVWWEDSATISGGIISKTFTPYMDGGANKVAFFFSIVDKTGASYRINGSINFLSSPGGDMHELPLPTKTLDFKWIDVKNPELSPFALSSESEALYKVITNVVRSAAVTNAGAVNKSKAYADSRFLPLTGGTLTSNLVVNGNVSASNITLDSVSSIDFNGGASYSHDEYGLILENDSESIRFSNTNKTVVSKLKPDGSDILTKTVADGLYEPLGGGGGMSPTAVTNIVKSAAVTNEGAKAYSDANMRSKPDMNVYVEQYANWTDNAGTVYVFSSHIGNDIVWTNGSDYVIETLNTIESWRWSMSKNGRTAHSHDAFPEDSLSVSMSNSGGDYWVLTRPYYVRILKDSGERLATEKYATSVANAKAFDSFVAGTNYTDSAVATRQTNLLHTVAQNGKILGCINETLTWVENGGGPTSGVTRAESTNIAHSVVSQDVAGWAMKGRPKPTGMTTNAVIDIASSSSVTNAGAVSVATDMFEELDYWKRDYGDRTWEEERYTPWYIRYAKDPSGNYDEVLEGILDEYSITTNGVFYYPRPGVGGWWSRYGNEPTDAYVINSVVESGPTGAQATVIEAIYTRKSDGVQITVDSFRVFIRGENLLITSDLDSIYLNITNLYRNLISATSEIITELDRETHRAKKAETNIAHCATNYTDAAATASTNYTDEVAIKKGGESRVYDDILLKGEDGSTVLQRVDSEWRFGGGSDYADKLYNQDTDDAIYLEDGKWYIGVETTPIKKEISTIDDINATNALLSAELANEKYERETADTKFLTKASTSYPSTRQLKWQGYDLVLLGPMRFDGWSSIKAGTTSPGTTLPEYLKGGSWNTATDPFAKKSDIVSASSVTNIVASEAVTNGGAKTYADATFLKKSGGTIDGSLTIGNGGSPKKIIFEHGGGSYSISSDPDDNFYFVNESDSSKHASLNLDGTPILTKNSADALYEPLGSTTNKYTRNIRSTANIGVHTVDPTTGYVDLAMEGKTMQEGLEYLVQERKLPDAPTYPKINSVTLSGYGDKEVGTTFSPSYTVNVSLGSYQYGPTPTGSAFDQFVVSDSSGGTSSSQTGTFTSFTVLDSTEYKVTAKAHHTQGHKPKDNLGADVEDSTKRIQAMWYDKKDAETSADAVSSGIVSGFRKWFVYVGTSLETIDSAFIRASTYDYGNAKVASTKNGVVIPAGTKRVMIAMPKYSASLGYDKALTSVIDVDGMGLDIFSNFVKTNVSVAAYSTSAPAMDYNVWTFENTNGLSASHFNFVISTTSLTATQRGVDENGYENSVPLNISLNRQFGGPLDVSDVFYSKNDLDYYRTKKRLTEGVSAYWLSRMPYPYDGQIVSLSLSSCAPTNYVLKANSTNEFDLVQIQYELESGKTIKTINEQSLLGSGNVNIHGMTTNEVKDIVSEMPIVKTNESGFIKDSKIWVSQVVDIPGLCFVAGTQNSVVSMKNEGDAPDISLEYTVDGMNWNSFVTNYTVTPIVLSKIGDRAWIRATSSNERLGSSFSAFWQFELTGMIGACGSIEYLRNKDGRDTALSAYCYNSTFKGCSSLTSCPLLPATTLADYCYNSLFQGCSSLTSAPSLPATTLEVYCYNFMFQGCTSLMTPPQLPAITLAKQCYRSMFSGCTALKEAPALPATTVPDMCYRYMFSGCTSLKSAPLLPATTLSTYCYANMFAGCTSLTSPPALPATILAKYCYNNMFNGCTALTSAPDLPATTLEDRCYNSMFSGCMALKLSETKTNEYTTSYRIPSSGDAVSVGADAMTSMFLNTGGTFAGTPAANAIYYGAWDSSPCVTSNTVNRILASPSVTNEGAVAKAKKYADDTFLPLSGGTVTGDLYCADRIHVGSGHGYMDSFDFNNLWLATGNGNALKIGPTSFTFSLYGFVSTESELIPDGTPVSTHGSISNAFPIVTNSYTKGEVNAALSTVPTTVSNIVTKTYVEDLGIEAGVSALTVTGIVKSAAVTNAGSVAYANDKFLPKTGGTVYGTINVEGADGADSAYIRLGKEDVLPGCFWLNPYGGGNESSSYGDLDFYWPDDGITYSSMPSESLMRKKDVSAATSGLATINSVVDATNALASVKANAYVVEHHLYTTRNRGWEVVIDWTLPIESITGSSKITVRDMGGAEVPSSHYFTEGTWFIELDSSGSYVLMTTEDDMPGATSSATWYWSPGLSPESASVVRTIALIPDVTRANNSDKLNGKTEAQILESAYNSAKVYADTKASETINSAKTYTDASTLAATNFVKANYLPLNGRVGMAGDLMLNYSSGSYPSIKFTRNDEQTPDYEFSIVNDTERYYTTAFAFTDATSLPKSSYLVVDGTPVVTSNMMNNVVSTSTIAKAKEYVDENYLPLTAGTGHKLKGDLVFTYDDFGRILIPVGEDTKLFSIGSEAGGAVFDIPEDKYFLFFSGSLWSYLNPDNSDILTAKKAETDYPVITNAYTKAETDAAFAKKLTGKEYDFEGGTNFTLHLYTALTNVIQEMGGTIKNPPVFQ